MHLTVKYLDEQKIINIYKYLICAEVVVLYTKSINLDQMQCVKLHKQLENTYIKWQTFVNKLFNVLKY